MFLLSSGSCLLRHMQGNIDILNTQTQTFENLYSSCQRCVATALMYSYCYSYCYQCLVKSTANLDVINLNKIGMHVAFISPKRIAIESHAVIMSII